jgi:deoxyribodipyrimidine photolyase-related protein
MTPVRNLILVLGDQLDAESSAFDGFDPKRDAVWMAEVEEEASHVWSLKTRTAVFLSAMRHFREALRARLVCVHYRELDDPENAGSLEAELVRSMETLKPGKLIIVQPGEWRVREQIEKAAGVAAVPLEERSDRHFLCTLENFKAHAAGRAQLRMEFFYREMRRRHRVLLDEKGGPEGGRWNFDPENRGHFPATGPGALPSPRRFPPDAITREVLALVEARFAKRPGKLEAFDWPVTPEEARLALEDFVEHRLVRFGEYQDAMWADEPWLLHSRLSLTMNLKLLDPRVVIAAAEKAYRDGRAPLASVEGFIRQILGWREYVRGVYWLFMPEYAARNALHAREPLPAFYWHGDVEMNCLRQALRQTLDLGYAHHIQRLMVTGLYSLLLGVRPQETHRWYLAVYVDAVEWVELPNVLGMSQYGDGGVMASKPYVATGNYIKRMSNYCAGCRFDPVKSVGDEACPFTTLYWDFLLRHEELLAANQRMALQVKNLGRLTPAQRADVQRHADEIRTNGGEPPKSQREKTGDLFGDA